MKPEQAYEFHTLYDAIQYQESLTPDAPALYYMGRTLSFRTLISETDRFAAVLQSLGVREGQPVTISLPNIPQAVIAFYAVSRIGAIAHMVHPLAPETQLRRYMDEVNSGLAILLDIHAHKYPDILSNKRVIVCSPAHYLSKIKRCAFALMHRKTRKALRGAAFSYGEGMRKRKPSLDPPVQKDNRQTAVYLHSGGTGGEPKAIELSAFSINALCGQGLDILNVPGAAGLTMLSVLPMFHGFGLAMGVHAMMCNGGSNAIMPKFHTKDVIRLTAKGRLHYMIGVPAMYEAMLRSPDFSGEGLKSLRMCFVGGDFVSQNLLDRFNARMQENGSAGRLFEGYGLTETVTVCSVNTMVRNRKGSIGKPLKNVRIAAFSPEYAPLPPGTEGELCIAGETLMNGYLNAPDETERVFFTADGVRYVKSGDIGHVDADGFVYFKSRQKRMVKVSGIPIFPSEIEHFIATEYAEVRDIAAVDVPDERTDNKLVLFLTTTDEFAAAARADYAAFTAEMSARIEQQLSVYARPKEILILDALPKTLVSKVDTEALKKQYGNKE